MFLMIFSQFSGKNSNKMLHYFEIRIKCIFSIFSKFQNFREKNRIKMLHYFENVTLLSPPPRLPRKKKVMRNMVGSVTALTSYTHLTRASLDHTQCFF